MGCAQTTKPECAPGAHILLSWRENRCNLWGSRQDNTIQGCAHKKKKKASGLQFFSCPKPQKAGDGGRVGEEVEVIGEEVAASFWLVSTVRLWIQSKFLSLFYKKKKRCMAAFTKAREAQRLASTPKKPLVRNWESGGGGGVCGGWRKVKLEHQAPWSWRPGRILCHLLTLKLLSF